MRTTTLGRSNLRVSRIAFGTWQLGGDWGATDETSAIAAIRQAADRGVTFFDTAQAYGFGASERLLADGLRGRARADVVIATKGGLRRQGSDMVRDASPAWIRQGVDDSLRALETDYIDLFQIHWPDPRTPLVETADELAKLVADDKIRHVGVSNFSPGQMEELSTSLPVETVQPPYSLFRRAIEADVLPYAAAHDIGVLVYGPLAHGLLGGHLTANARFAAGDWRAASDVFRGEAFRRNLAVVGRLQDFARNEMGISLGQLAVAWTLANPDVQVAIVGTRNPAHVDDALSAADIDLDDGTRRRIDEIMGDATPIGGPTPETT